ncbi:hypothetical protein ACTA71_011350 [Dictyostelium dimigraforme]
MVHHHLIKYGADFTTELPGGIKNPYKIYFNPSYNDLICPCGNLVGCMVENQVYISVNNSLSEPHIVTYRSDEITLKYQSALLLSINLSNNCRTVMVSLNSSGNTPIKERKKLLTATGTIVSTTEKASIVSTTETETMVPTTETTMVSTTGTTLQLRQSINFIPKQLVDIDNFNQSKNYIMIDNVKCNEAIWITFQHHSNHDQIEFSLTVYSNNKWVMKSQVSPDDNIIPKPTLPPIPPFNDYSTCLYDSNNPYPTILQPTIWTNIKCTTIEKELHYDHSHLLR